MEGIQYDAAIEDAVVGSPEVGFAFPYGSLIGMDMVLKGGNTLNFR